MLNIGTLSSFDSAVLLPSNKFNFSLTGPLFPFSSKTPPFVSSSHQTQQTHLSFRTRDSGLSLLCFSALNSKRGNDGIEVVEADGSDFDDFEDFDEDGVDDDEDVGMYLPFGKMKRWLENKPRGFGEGKVYDTSIEDKLLQEIEQSRQAQIANIDELKNDPVKTSPKKDEGKKKG